MCFYFLLIPVALLQAFHILPLCVSAKQDVAQDGHDFKHRRPVCSLSFVTVTLVVISLTFPVLFWNYTCVLSRFLSCVYALLVIHCLYLLLIAIYSICYLCVSCFQWLSFSQS